MPGAGAADAAEAAAAAGAAVSTLICVEPEGTLMCSVLCLVDVCDTTLQAEVDDSLEKDPPPPICCTEHAEEAAEEHDDDDDSPSVWHRLFCPGE